MAECTRRDRGSIAVATILAALVGCGGGERAVTVPAAPSSTTAEPTRATLSLRDSARVARARAALADYCEAVRSGRNPADDSEVAALAVLATVFIRNPSARFGQSDSPLALAEVLKAEAGALDEGECDPKSADLLRNLVDVVLRGRSR